MIISRKKLLVSAAALALLLGVALSPQLLGAHVASAFESLRGAERHWLLVAAFGFVGAFVCTVGAWRAALAAAGERICPKRAAACLGVGSMVNSFAPAKLGDAVKIALFSKAIDTPGPLWTAGGVYAALAAARSLVLAALLIVASATGAMPLWPVFALCALVAALAVAAGLSGRLRRHPRIAQVLSGLVALERSPRALVTVLGWTAAMVVARLGATMAIAAALGIPHPVLAALLILPALDVASAFPVTPGSIGIGSGAVAVALASRGIGMNQALGVGFAIQAVETVVVFTTGAVGTLYLANPRSVVRRWTLRIATVGASIGVAAGVGLLVLEAF
ncbi:MAG TPA: lysylphosphatidylglycerol synthase domain-containing protein [Gaiellaceae bacterium]|nr:lysylphosphatidylglycerol synthase domain-containing protein [Gaiellaceae bacterium]